MTTRYQFPDARIIAEYKPSDMPECTDDEIVLRRASDGQEIGGVQRTLLGPTRFIACMMNDARNVMFNKPSRKTYAKACEDFLELCRHHNVGLD